MFIADITGFDSSGSSVIIIVGHVWVALFLGLGLVLCDIIMRIQ